MNESVSTLAPSAPIPFALPPQARLSWVSARDGTRLRTAVWPDGGNGVVLILTGRTEFIEKYVETAADLQARGFAVACFDWRGQGGSGRMLDNPHKGHIDDFATYLDDLDHIVEAAVRPLLGPARRRLIVLGHSMGGHLALRWLHDRPGLAERVALSAPMVDILMPPALRRIVDRLAWTAVRCGLRSAYCVGEGDYRPDRNPFEGNPLTGDRERFARLAETLQAHAPLALGGPTWGWLDAALRSIRLLRAPGFPEAIATPVLVAQAGEDRIVCNAAQTALAARLPAGRRIDIPEARHEILLERPALRAAFWQAFDSFVERPAASK